MEILFNPNQNNNKTPFYNDYLSDLIDEGKEDEIELMRECKFLVEKYIITAKGIMILGEFFALFVFRSSDSFKMLQEFLELSVLATKEGMPYPDLAFYIEDPYLQPVLIRDDSSRTGLVKSKSGRNTFYSSKKELKSELSNPFLMGLVPIDSKQPKNQSKMKSMQLQQ